MQFQLTPSVNVPAERAKLRRLRNEINEEAQARLNYERNYTARGYRRAQLPDLSELDAQTPGRPGRNESHEPHGAGSVRTGAEMDVSTAATDMREAQAGCARCCCAAGGLGREGVKA